MQPIQIVKDYDYDAMILCNNILQSFKLKTLQRDPFAKFDMQNTLILYFLYLNIYKLGSP